MSTASGPVRAERAQRRADLRLFGPAAGVWAASLAALYASARVALIGAAVVAVAVAGVVVLPGLLPAVQAAGEAPLRHSAKARCLGVGLGSPFLG